MLNPMTWRPQPWAAQPLVQTGGQNGHFWPRREPTLSMNHHARLSATSPSWASAMMPQVQDFVPPAALQPAQNELRDGLSWFNMTGRPQLGTTSNPDCPYTAPIGTSSLSRFPFFRSQILKQESNKAERKKQRSKIGSSVVKQELSPKVMVTSLPQWPSITGDNRQAVTSSNLLQATKFLGATKRPFDLVEHGVLRVTPPTVKVHIQSLKHPRGTEATIPYNLSGRITMRLPKTVAPAAPDLVRSTLETMKPVIVYAQYECADECRSRGICVHFSFLLGCRQVPDGLICPSCQAAQVERSYSAHRVCPRHNKRSLSQFTPNLPEDYLPSTAQSHRAFEILERSCSGDWEGTPSKVSGRTPNATLGHIEDVDGIENPGQRNEGDNGVLPSIEANCHSTERAQKRQRTSPKEEALARKHSSGKENSNEEPDTAGQAHSGNCGLQDEDGNRTPRASMIKGDPVEAGSMVDTNAFSTSFPTWSPEPALDFFS